MFSDELKKNILAMFNTYHNTVIAVFGDPNVFGWALVSAGDYISELLESSAQTGLEDFQPLSPQDLEFLKEYTFFVIDPDGDITPLPQEEAREFWFKIVSSPDNIEQLNELGV